MRVLLAGASGALGHSLTPALVQAGHEVYGTTRSGNTASIAKAGATPLRMDGLDRESVLSAVEEAKPDVIIHQLTALRAGMDPRQFDRTFGPTNRLRTEGTDHLLEAARTFEVGRFLAQSFTGWTNPRTGTGLADETTGLDPDPAPQSRQTLAAIRHVEEAVGGATDLEGVVLRYGGFYGPGTGIAKGEDGEILQMIRRRKMPLVGDGAGVWCFVHAVDAASATVAAVERGAPGLYNIVDDEPAPMSEWLPGLAEAVGAKPPRHVPVWLARLLIGEHGVNLMTKIRGSSNAKAKRELGWTLKYPTWRIGFAQGL
ncbi:MAG TPA: NAD(P)-dependent oxidoreductase [Intrasporangium sp.]|uniref:NAD-dependent epimerase/dehydratase family protein n=1 Tax=Intrasporangium sp. TaxID=1925024 RepID=UPI002B49FB5C|nr:NAD(P)-dependent oxidoreductase [Intrasporangium sp.]HKX66235.1 NAD(P)-dependent oxidoreductase [Intrasporangium sp.]